MFSPPPKIEQETPWSIPRLCCSPTRRHKRCITTRDKTQSCIRVVPRQGNNFMWFRVVHCRLGTFSVDTTRRRDNWARLLLVVPKISTRNPAAQAPARPTGARMTRAHNGPAAPARRDGRRLLRAHERGRGVLLRPVRPGGAVAEAQADELAAPALPDVRPRRRRAQLRPDQLRPELRRRESLRVRARLPGQVRGRVARRLAGEPVKSSLKSLSVSARASSSRLHSRAGWAAVEFSSCSSSPFFLHGGSKAHLPAARLISLACAVQMFLCACSWQVVSTMEDDFFLMWFNRLSVHFGDCVHCSQSRNIISIIWTFHISIYKNSNTQSCPLPFGNIFSWHNFGSTSDGKSNIIIWRWHILTANANGREHT